MSEENVSTSGLIAESIKALKDPKAYFAAMPTSGGFGAPIMKALFYGVIAGVFGFIWSVLGFSALGGLSTMFGGGAGIMVLIGSIIGALIGLFIGGVIILIISAICGGDTNYEANIRVTASLMVISPVSSAFGFLYGISFILGSIIALLINLYGIWMLFHALNGSLKAKPSTAKVVSIVIGVVYIIFFFIGLGTAKLAEKYPTMMENPNSEEMAEMAKSIAGKIGGEEAEKAVAEAMDGQEGFSLETSGGDVIEAPTLTQLVQSLGELDSDEEFCILSKGEDFIQTAYSEKGFIVQYKDATGQYESSELLGQPTVIMIFSTYLNGDDSWKQSAQWEKMQ
ncbi:MAG TPA: YIP1 family protein [Calditrichaeota bacterium]|nr:YIP1 family protein [Calditrichota bacterium]